MEGKTRVDCAAKDIRPDTGSAQQFQAQVLPDQDEASAIQAAPDHLALLGRAEGPVGLRREDYLGPESLRNDHREQQKNTLRSPPRPRRPDR